jgi:hypothetical protein
LIWKVVAGTQKLDTGEVGSRESTIGRNDFKKTRPGVEDEGMVSRGPWWTVVETIVVDMLEDGVVGGVQP